ncbi:MAG UNVERIFIED_CONTAM: hypothetical protein LVR18_50750 [Planctomycetaceae bacterium]
MNNIALPLQSPRRQHHSRKSLLPAGTAATHSDKPRDSPCPFPSSSVTNVIPAAVDGRCRISTKPATRDTTVRLPYPADAPHSPLATHPAVS